MNFQPFKFIFRFTCTFILLGWLITPYPALAKTANANLTQSIQPYVDGFIERVTEFTLDNGLKFIVLENHDAPVVSFVTYADVGGANEPDGKTGVAHFLEHLAFKGTKEIGTKDYQAEKLLLEQSDQLFAQIKSAKAEGKTDKVAQLSQEFAETQAEAAKLIKQNEFGQIVEQAGGENLNAATSADFTVYFYSLPSNKLELWMSLESERFLEPVFREFYKEQQVIIEERHTRTDNSPVGRLVEAFLGTAFTEHPYKRPVIGYADDIANLSREDVETFFNAYYAPNNLTIAIAGDVNPTQVKQLAQVYFGRYSAQPLPPKVSQVEPKQNKPREVTVTFPSQPWYLEGYHRPAVSHPDNGIYEVLTAIMSNGRTSRLYQSLVEEQKVALVAQGFNGFPGDKYPTMLLFYAQTAPNATLEQVETAFRQEIERLKTEPVSDQELERVKNQIRASILRSLDSNLGMARSLVEYEVKTGDWRNIFQQVDAIEQVTSEDIQRIAQETFIQENRTIGRLISEK
ncbi:MAG: M16 family metallopeptidase [Microcystaceae cyanobacterium]